ncbi:MAG: hypothetical protein H6525_07000 [Actinobacteria bacterium]|nr:hypothetical protein [Actinomycetota bacterium]
MSTVQPDRTRVAATVWFAILALMAGLVTALSAATPAQASGQQVFDGPNGPVEAIVSAGDTTYVGGTFTRWGPQTGGWAALDPVNGAVDRTMAAVAGVVWSAIPDGAGGWYIGGDFSAVAGQPRDNLARILSTGEVDPNWNPGTSSAVFALALAGNTVYIGGQFNRVAGETRVGLGAVDATTGAVKAWNPSVNSPVFALVVSGVNVYIGGAFSTVSGQTRNRLAAVDATTGTLAGWNPNVNLTVFSMVQSGSTLYIGGQFTTVGGQPRNRLAAVNMTNGAVTGWNPDASDTVRVITMSGSTVYAGGHFTAVGGQVRNRLAAMDATTGALTGWNPDANDIVLGLTSIGSTVYVGGAFTSVGGQPRNRLAATDASTGAVSAWNPDADGNVFRLASSGTTVYAGGNFQTIGGQTRNRLAAVDTDTGVLSNWHPDVDGDVNALAVSGSTVYVGGAFTSIGGQLRNNLAAVDATTAAATGWNPNANGPVLALTNSGNTVYAGGAFSSVGGQVRQRLAAMDTTSGIVTGWSPTVGGVSVPTVRALALSGSTVYAGGEFTTVAGQPRNNIVAVDAVTGTPTSWNPSPIGSIEALAVAGGTVYAGGQFTDIGGQPRNNIAALDATTAAASGWNPNSDQPVLALAVAGSTVYAGGGFTAIGGQLRNGVAALDATTGAAGAWDPNANEPVNALAVNNGTVFAGGLFTTIGLNKNGAPSARYFAALPTLKAAPGPPQNLTANPRYTAAELEFTPGDNGGGTISDYEYRSKEPGEDWGPWMSAGVAASPVMVTGLPNGVPVDVELRAVNEAGPGAAAATVVTPIGAVFSGLESSIRVFDSRASQGGGGPLTPTIPVTVDVQAPPGTVAVSYNLTLVGTVGVGHVAVGPADADLTGTSTANWFASGQRWANAYVSAVDDAGMIQLIARGGPTDAIVDVTGFYLADGQVVPLGEGGQAERRPGEAGPAQTLPAATEDSLFVSVPPQRAYDSRTSDGPISSGQERTIDLSQLTPELVPPGANGVAYTLTVTRTEGSGHLSVGAPGAGKPATSVINWFETDQNIANSATGALAGDRSLAVFGGGGPTEFIIDILGYFIPVTPPAQVATSNVEGLRFTAIDPSRAYDSRPAAGGVGPLTRGESRTTSAIPASGAVPPGVGAVAFNLTEADTVERGHLRVAPGGAARPSVSTINWYTDGMRLANGTVVDVANDQMTTHAGATENGSANYIVDIGGYYN